MGTCPVLMIFKNGPLSHFKRCNQAGQLYKVALQTRHTEYVKQPYVMEASVWTRAEMIAPIAWIQLPTTSSLPLSFPFNSRIPEMA